MGALGHRRVWPASIAEIAQGLCTPCLVIYIDCLTACLDSDARKVARENQRVRDSGSQIPGREPGSPRRDRHGRPFGNRLKPSQITLCHETNESVYETEGGAWSPAIWHRYGATIGRIKMPCRKNGNNKPGATSCTSSLPVNSLMKAVRLNRLFNPKTHRCFDAAIDHGFFNEASFLAGIKNLPRVVEPLVEAAWEFLK